MSLMSLMSLTPLGAFLQPLVDINDAIIKFFHDTLGFGWGPSIIGLTVTIRLAILPLTFKQIRSMQALQRLAPEMKKIQQRFKEDKKRQQQEIMAFYQEHQVNPLASCFPLLLQLPFFIGLYQTLKAGGTVSNEIKHSADPGFLFIPDLTKPATGAVLVALIVIYVGTQLGASLVTMINAQDQNQRRIMLALPFIFVFVIIRFPAGLIVYWITTNVWTIGQQLAVKRFLPAPEPLPAGAAAATSSGGAKAAAGGGDGASAPAKGRGGRAAKATSDRGSDGGNGGPRKPPPPSPRKKKKRSGRRR